VNFLPVRFRGHTFAAGVRPFESAEQLAALREELAGSHVVRRDGDRIVCVPLTAEAREVGELQKFEVGEHRALTMRLVQEALIREVIAMRYKLCAFSRPSFISRYPQHDLLALAAGDQGQALAALHVYPEYRLDARTSGPGSQPGIIVGLKTRNEIDLTVADLLARGLQVEGRYVLAETGEVRFNPALDDRVYRRLIGAVDSISDGRLLLRDAPGIRDIAADQAWVEARRGTFQDTVAALTGGRHGSVLELLEEAKFGLLGAAGRLARVTALAERLAAGGAVAIAAGLEAEVGLPAGTAPAQSRSRRVTFTTFREPTFVFDPAGDKTHRSAEKGLAEFGPFDSEFFTPRRPKILVLTPRAFQGTAEVFMDRFRRGVPDAKVYTQGSPGNTGWPTAKS